MAETNGGVREPHGPDHDEEGPSARGDHRIDIAGNASGTVIAGNHNVVIDAHGSTVNLLPPRERPRPVRRERVALVPRRQREPVGREADLEELESALHGHGLVQLWGPPGVGKSTLLRHAARCLEPGPDGVLFFNAAHREVEDLAQEIFEACYEAPGYAPTGPELRRLMAGVRVTVYADDVDLTPEQLRLLADAAPDATFVLANRERSLLGEGGHLELRGLDRAAGLELLTRELGHPLPQGELVAANELCMLSLGRPLLLLRAAGLAGFDTSGEVTLPRPAEIEGLLPLLLDRLDAAAVTALHLLATLRDAEVDPVHVGALCGVPEPAVVCGRLAELGLAVVTERGYRSVADVVPEVRRRSPEGFPADRLCDHFARWAALPTTTPAQVADHGRALELAAELAEQQGRPDLAVRVARAVSPVLAQSLRFGVWGRLLDQGQNAAQQAGDVTARAYFTHEKAIRCLLIGRRVLAAVLLAEAVVLWRQLGDSEGVNAALNAQQYTPPPSSLTPDAGPPGGDVGTTLGNDAGTAAGTDPGTTVGADAGTAPGTTSGTDPGTTVGTDPGTVPGTDPAVASGADPGAASAADAGAQPGVDTGGAPNTPVDPVTQLATNPSGATTAGGAAAGGGTTAVGVGALSTGVITTLVGIVAAIAIGVGIYQEQASNDESPTSSTSTPSDELAGVWRDGQGNVFRITESGDGSYQFKMQGNCGGSSTVEITGSSGSYSATVPVWDESSCGTTVGEADLRIDVDSDGSSADVEMTEKSDGTWKCYTCGTQSWTRLS
ncbi:ATP-binding protein [Streptomyces violaceusniger]|uniref:AAA ATPase n=1 Tax=Streptomyces violaceusniger (strain Tu 4113) TaxID=653045 RepID=G2PCZ2_STRV4|nr:ATP-binding protein [Streptomyces violaceusniger]AEM82618.1 AAA ATPase [Streptomyces violaceusniger Tu 4113]